MVLHLDVINVLMVIHGVTCWCILCTCNTWCYMLVHPDNFITADCLSMLSGLETRERNEKNHCMQYMIYSV